MIDCNKVIKDIEYAKDLLQNRPEQDTVDYKVYEVLDDALDLIHDLRSQIAMLVGAQHAMAKIMAEKQNRINIEQTLDETYGVTGGTCPTCGNWIQSAHSFCGFCGQPIGWKKQLLDDGMERQGCATIKEPDCRICGQSHCKYYHESRKPTECKSYIRMKGR